MTARKSIVLVQAKTEFQTEYTHRPHLPLWLLAVSRFLRRDHEIMVLDERLGGGWGWWQRLAEALESDPVCIGLTCLTGKQIRHALAISEFVKARTKSPIVWGGPHATVLPEQTLGSEAIDFVVQGEGEHIFPALVRALERGADPFAIPGVWGKEGGGARGLAPEGAVDLDSLPSLPYSLVDLDDYKMHRQHGDTLLMETSRGCPFQCRFCYCSRRPGWRAMRPARVLDGMEELAVRHGVRSLLIVDENFFVDIERAREIFRGLVSRHLGIRMETQGLRASDVVHRMDGDFLHLMQRAGMSKLDIGAESGSARILDFIRKGIGPEEVVEANRKLAGYDFLVKFNFIVGFPTETREEMRQTIDFAFRLLAENPRADVGWIHVYASQPGTTLHAWEVDHGLVPPRALAEWALVDRQGGGRRSRKLTESIYFTSHFMRLERGYRFMFRSRAALAVLSLYRPVALFRLRRFFFPLMIEWAAVRWLMAFASRWMLWTGRLHPRRRVGG